MSLYLMISVIMVQIFYSHTKPHYRTNGALQNVKAGAPSLGGHTGEKVHLIRADIARQHETGILLASLDAQSGSEQAIFTTFQFSATNSNSHCKYISNTSHDNNCVALNLNRNK